MLSSEFNIESLCIAIGLSRSGYYKWLKRKGTLNRYQNDRLLLCNMLKEYHSKHKTWGYRHIAAEIRKDTGWIFSDNLCHKCCKTLKIHSKARKSPYKKPGEESIKYPNIIWNNWDTSRPFEKIVTDTTIFYNDNKQYDLTLYIDVFNKEIVAYDLANGKHGSNPSNHIRALKKLLKAKIKRGYRDLETIVHSDQGIIYSSTVFANTHKDYNIKRSMSRAGTPTDNPIIESLNGWIKEELAIDFNLYKTNNIHKTINEYIKYYNNDRLAYSLQYKSPVQYRTELAFN